MENAEKLLAVSEEEKFIKNYKSVYQAMTAKHDCKSKIFPRSIIIGRDDVIELNRRVCDKLSNYENAGFTINVMASLSGRDAYEFSTWQEFEAHIWDESNEIVSLTIIWEFNAVLPQYQIPQKHVLVVKMADGLRPEEMLNIVFAGKLENIEDIDKQMYPVVARVDYINNILGDELLNIVECWNKGLVRVKNKEHRLISFGKKHKRKIAFVIDYVTKIVLIYSLLKVFLFMLLGLNHNKLADITIGELSGLIQIGGVLLVLWMIFSRVAEWLARTCFETFNIEVPRHVFRFTRGDNDLQQKIEKGQGKNYFRIAVSVASTIILNILCNVISNLIVSL